MFSKVSSFLLDLVFLSYDVFFIGVASIINFQCTGWVDYDQSGVHEYIFQSNYLKYTTHARRHLMERSP